MNVKMKQFFLFLGIILAYSIPITIDSCTSEPETTNTYTIFQGDHYCTPHPVRLFSGSTLTFDAKFGSDCHYDLANNNQGDLNKLFGFSDNNSLIHIHSARFAWRWMIETQNIEVWAYSYISGSVRYDKIGETTLGAWDHYQVSASGSKYTYTFNGTVIEHPRTAPSQGLKTISFPYFGGDELATHDMTIYIKEL